MRCFATANQKGGVGKTTTAVSLGAACAEVGDKVLLVDLDPQAGLTVSLGLNPDEFEQTTYPLLLGLCAVTDTIVPSHIKGVDLIPANLDLAAAEPELIGEINWAGALREALGTVREQYDRIFLDCPPSLGVLTTNGLVSADMVIIPLQCEYLAMRGIQQLQRIIEKVRRQANPNLGIRVLRTMFDVRTRHSKEVSSEIEAAFDKAVFAPIVRRSVRFADATVAGEPITLFAKDSEVAEAYRAVAEEVRK